jgi:hypothetical protein
VDNVEVRFLPEESSRVIALRSGEVDPANSSPAFPASNSRKRPASA